MEDKEKLLIKKSMDIGIMIKNKADINEINNLKRECLLLKEEVNKIKTERILEGFKTMKPFEDIYDIPRIPIVNENIYKEIIITNLIRCGAIPKKDLIVGETYIGKCRNSNEAIWNGIKFEYKRFKFMTWMDDVINHFEDDNGYDLFIPIKIKE